MQCICKLGRNFKAIADVIGTKSEAQLRSFYTNQKTRYNLDALVRKYEIDNGIRPEPTVTATAAADEAVSAATFTQPTYNRLKFSLVLCAFVADGGG